eukprot:COSAG02_NODE_728_length_17995_cov_52.042244_3_plen_102_part_00
MRCTRQCCATRRHTMMYNCQAEQQIGYCQAVCRRLESNLHLGLSASLLGQTAIAIVSICAFKRMDINARAFGVLHQWQLIFLLARAVFRSELVVELLHLVS